MKMTIRTMMVLAVALSFGTVALAGKEAAKPAPAKKEAVKAAPAKKEAVKAAPTKKEAVKAAPSTKKAAEKGTVVVLESTDQMMFNLKKIEVKAGSTVTLTLKHTGKLPKAAMGHNFVLLKKGTDVAKFSALAMKAGVAHHYVPKGDAVIAFTKVIGGGESVTITFTAPAAGTYDFICSFPGHYAMMKGKFITK